VIESQADMRLVGTAASGSEALEVFRRLQPDITLMDIQMPDLNGIDATIAIRKEFPQAKIIILTTYEGDARLARRESGRFRLSAEKHAAQGYARYGAPGVQRAALHPA
jgi:DNA-binding NarL/FixJ family response regulator